LNTTKKKKKRKKKENNNLQEDVKSTELGKDEQAMH
jgi:hypothetical protein